MFQGNFEGQLALLAGADLRSRLTDQLVRGHSECMVCLERVKQHHNTWDCHNCFQVCIHEKLHYCPRCLVHLLSILMTIILGHTMEHNILSILCIVTAGLRNIYWLKPFSSSKNTSRKCSRWTIRFFLIIIQASEV